MEKKKKKGMKIPGLNQWGKLRMTKLLQVNYEAHFILVEFSFSDLYLATYFQGDLHAFLKRKGALKTATAVKFALDIARSFTQFIC